MTGDGDGWYISDSLKVVKRYSAAPDQGHHNKN